MESEVKAVEWSDEDDLMNEVNKSLKFLCLIRFNIQIHTLRLLWVHRNELLLPLPVNQSTKTMIWQKKSPWWRKSKILATMSQFSACLSSPNNKHEAEIRLFTGFTTRQSLETWIYLPISKICSSTSLSKIHSSFVCELVSQVMPITSVSTNRFIWRPLDGVHDAFGSQPSSGRCEKSNEHWFFLGQSFEWSIACANNGTLQSCLEQSNIEMP